MIELNRRRCVTQLNPRRLTGLVCELKTLVCAPVAPSFSGPKCKSKGKGKGDDCTPTPIAFPNVAVNPGIIRALENLASGTFVFIRFKASGAINFVLGTYVGFCGGAVTLINSFNALTLAGGIGVSIGLAEGAIPTSAGLSFGSFRATETVVDAADISAVDILPFDLSRFFDNAAAAGTVIPSSGSMSAMSTIMTAFNR